MKKINSLLKKKNLPGAIIGGLIFILLGIGMFCITNTDFWDFATARDYLFDHSYYEIDCEKYYDVSNDLLFDWYASDDDGYYYITAIPDYDDYYMYMGYYVYNKDCETASRIVENTWLLLDEDEAAAENYQSIVLKGKGFVYEMEGMEKDYFDAYLDAAGIPDSSRVYMTAVLVPLKKAIMLDSDDYFFIFLGGIFTVIGMVLLIRALAGGYKKNYVKSVKSFNVSEENLEAELEYAEKVGNLYVTRNFFFYPGANPFVIPASKLIWCYKKEERTKHTAYGFIPLGTTKAYSVVMLAEDGKTYSVLAKSGEEANNIINAAIKKAPAALYGYTVELSALCLNHFADAVAAVKEGQLNAGSDSTIV